MSKLYRRPMAVLSISIAALLGATLLAATSQANPVSTTAAAQSTSSSGAPIANRSEVKPTVVMVHGGWADSSGWNAEIAAARKQGYPVIAPANPLRGLSSDADYIRSILQTIDGPIVLVGHSYGGAVISNAARSVDNVEALVYIAAFAPDTGESLAQLVTKNPGTHITPDALIERPYPLPDGGTGVDLYLRASVFRTAFAGDLPKWTTRLMQATQRPFSVAAFTEGSGEPAWKTVPSWYLVATRTTPSPRRPRSSWRTVPAPTSPGGGLTRPDAVQARGNDQADPQGRQRSELNQPAVPRPPRWGRGTTTGNRPAGVGTGIDPRPRPQGP